MVDSGLRVDGETKMVVMVVCLHQFSFWFQNATDRPLSFVSGVAAAL